MKLYACFLLILIILIFQGCDTCKYLDCAVSNQNIYISLNEKASGNDLLFGPNAKYDAENVRFYSVVNKDTLWHNSTIAKYPKRNYDTVIHVSLSESHPQFFVQWGAGKTDTFNIAYQSYKTKCCGVITNIQSLLYNDINTNYSEYSLTELAE